MYESKYDQNNEDEDGQDIVDLEDPMRNVETNRGDQPGVHEEDSFAPRLEFDSQVNHEIPESKDDDEGNVTQEEMRQLNILEFRVQSLERLLNDVTMELKAIDVTDPNNANQVRDLAIQRDQVKDALKATYLDINKIHDFSKDQNGSGKTNSFNQGRDPSNQALWDRELIDILSPYKEFAGCVMRDEIPMLLDTMLAKKRKQFGFVLNLSPSTKDGTHWCAVYIDLTDRKQVCYYNSFGEEVPANILKELKQFVKDNHLPYMVKFKNNRMVNQTDRSNRCGYHCSNFLTTMFKTGDFQEATNFHEKHAKEHAKKFKKFGYI